MKQQTKNSIFLGIVSGCFILMLFFSSLGINDNKGKHKKQSLPYLTEHILYSSKVSSGYSEYACYLDRVYHVYSLGNEGHTIPVIYKDKHLDCEDWESFKKEIQNGSSKPTLGKQSEN